VGGKSELIIDKHSPAPMDKVWAVLTRLPTVRLSWLLFGLPLLLLLPDLNSFPYPAADAAYSDLTISHYPNIYFLKESINTWREIPLWSSTILSGYPFAANPLAGLWYPISWLLLITPLPLGFNLLVGLHLISGGIGMYLLMRQEGIGHISALFAGISFALLPKMFSHYGAGHLTLLFAVPWTPWLLWSQKADYKIIVKGRSISMVPGLILAVIYLADIRWGAFATLLWCAYSIAHRKVSWRKQIFSIVSQTILALLLSAPLILPLIEYSLLSTRSGMNPGEVLGYSLPAGKLLGLIFPGINGNHEWVLYSGGIVLILAMSAIILRNERIKAAFWGGVFLVSLVIALGSQWPGSEFLTRLPFVNLLRVPSRSLFLAGLSLAALSGYGLEKLLDKLTEKPSRLLNLVLFALVAFSLILAVGIYLGEGALPSGILWGGFFIAIGVLWIQLRFKTRIRFEVWIMGLFLIGLIDLGMVDMNSFQGRPADVVYSERESVAQYIAAQPGEFRIYSPSYSIPQQTAVRYGLELTDGVDPLQMESYAEFMESASGVPRTGYSVTMPPFKTGDPKVDNREYVPDAEKLGLLNVGYVVADYELNVPGLTFDRQFGEASVYKNELQMPRAWIQALDENLVLPVKPAEILDRRPNSMLISAEGPGKLVVSELNYPGWSVSVDGEKREIETAAGVLRAVKLDAGSHEINFVFKPVSLLIGLLLSIGGLFSMVLFSSKSKSISQN
jgi:hypothetical protein